MSIDGGNKSEKQLCKWLAFNLTPKEKNRRINSSRKKRRIIVTWQQKRRANFSEDKLTVHNDPSNRRSKRKNARSGSHSGKSIPWSKYTPPTAAGRGSIYTFSGLAGRN